MGEVEALAEVTPGSRVAARLSAGVVFGCVFAGATGAGVTVCASAAGFASASAVFRVASGPALAFSVWLSGTRLPGTAADGTDACGEPAAGAASWVPACVDGFSAEASPAFEVAGCGFSAFLYPRVVEDVPQAGAPHSAGEPSLPKDRHSPGFGWFGSKKGMERAEEPFR